MHDTLCGAGGDLLNLKDVSPILVVISTPVQIQISSNSWTHSVLAGSSIMAAINLSVGAARLLKQIQDFRSAPLARLCVGLPICLVRATLCTINATKYTD